MEFEKKRPDAADVPMNNEQVIGFDLARQAMKSGSSGLGAWWFVGGLPFVLGVAFESWILMGIGLIICVPTGIASVRRYRNRKMWEQPG